MGICMITFRSVTPAQQAELLLRRNGIFCTLGRTPRWMEEQGCGYSLRVSHQDLNRVTELLKGSKVAYRKIYLQSKNGKMEELER